MGHKKTFWNKDKEKRVGGMEVVKQDINGAKWSLGWELSDKESESSSEKLVILLRDSGGLQKEEWSWLIVDRDVLHVESMSKHVLILR